MGPPTTVESSVHPGSLTTDIAESFRSTLLWKCGSYFQA